MPIVDLAQPSQLFLNTDELAKNGHTVDDVARYVMALTQADTAAGGIGRSRATRTTRSSRPRSPPP